MASIKNLKNLTKPLNQNKILERVDLGWLFFTALVGYVDLISYYRENKRYEIHIRRSHRRA